MRTVILVVAVCVAGCEVKGGGDRTLRGNVSTSQFALTKGAVFVETPGGQRAAAEVGRQGAFQIQVPVDQPVRLVIATQSSPGRYRGVAHIGPEWHRVQPGQTLELGVVRPAGSQRLSITVDDDDDEASCSETEGGADLPYAAKLPLGKTWKLADSFAEKGPQPAKVLSVTMEGPAWRLNELRNNLSFTVTQADCDHVGGRDVGRDRAFVTWQDADGSVQTDHIDMRYCKSDGSGSSSTSAPEVETDSGPCKGGVLEVCKLLSAQTDADGSFLSTPPGPAPAGSCPGGSACTTNGQCSSQLCVNGLCVKGSGGPASDAGIN